MKTKKAKKPTSRCLTCKKNTGSTFAFIMGGAFVARGALQAMKQMEGYLSFGVHGAHSHGIDEPSAVIKVIDDQHLGEFEIAFCSTACLRGFLNTSVDALEQQLKKAAHKNRAT